MKAAAPLPPVGGVVFEDGLGKRRRLVNQAPNGTIELLCLRSALTAVPAFELALRERINHLASFSHAAFGQVLGVDRLGGSGASLAVLSECTPGVRLSDILAIAERRQLPLDIGTAVCLIRQLMAAIAILEHEAPDIAHSAVAPERIVITPNGRLVLVEHVLGAALEQLQYSQERYWKELRVALPPSIGSRRFDHRGDIMQAGLVAIALLLGRPLGEHEYPEGIRGILVEPWALCARDGHAVSPLPSPLRSWLGQALQLDWQHAFASGVEACIALDAALLASSLAVPESVETLIAQYHASVDDEPVGSGLIRFEYPPSSAMAPIVHGIEFSAIATIEPAALPVPRTLLEADVRTVPARRRQIIAVLMIALTAFAIIFGRHFVVTAKDAPSTGTLIVTTNPPGAQISIDGKRRGTTPVSLAIPAGEHIAELRGFGEPRTIPLTIRAGIEMSEHFDLPKSPSTRGELEVRTEPAGARVTVDNLAAGTSPLKLDLAVGEHFVTLQNERGSVDQRVTIKPGTTASLVVPLATAAGAALPGWIAVTAPLDVELYENGRLLGNSQSRRIMVPAGTHELEIVNQALGYRAARRVAVSPNKVASIDIEFPKGAIALNAIPWAEVWVDGEKVGETPIGNLPLQVGPHEIIFRHPDFGEQLRIVNIQPNVPVRLSVDLKHK